jgi:hypothetical protein
MEILAVQILLAFALLVGHLITVVSAWLTRSVPAGTGVAHVSGTSLILQLPSALFDAEAVAPPIELDA